MAAIVDISNTENGSGFEVEVEWVGFDKEENTWEDLAKIWIAAPQFVESVEIEAGTTDAAEAAIWYHAVSFFAIFV